MFQAIKDFFRKLFGIGESREDRIKRLATAAGLLIAANNPVKVGMVVSLLKGIMASLEKDGNREAVNGLVHRFLSELLKEAKPEEKAALVVLFGDLNYSAATDTIDADLLVLKALIEGFLAGMGS